MQAHTLVKGRRGRRAAAWIAGVVVWIIIGAALFTLFWRLDGHQRHLFEQLRHSRMTAGTLVSKKAADHDSFTYRYEDQHGRRHLGGGDGEGQEQGDPADLALGTEITVWYSPNRPSVSCYCTPAENRPQGLFGPELLISQFLAVPIGVATGIAWGRRRRTRSSSASSTARRRNVTTSRPAAARNTRGSR